MGRLDDPFNCFVYIKNKRSHKNDNDYDNGNDDDDGGDHDDQRQ